MKSYWCVRHRTGWCAASVQSKQPKEDTFSVRTKCAHYVHLPVGIEKRVPDCLDCKARLLAAERRGNASAGAESITATTAVIPAHEPETCDECGATDHLDRCSKAWR